VHEGNQIWQQLPVCVWSNTKQPLHTKDREFICISSSHAHTLCLRVYGFCTVPCIIQMHHILPDRPLIGVQIMPVYVIYLVPSMFLWALQPADAWTWLSNWWPSAFTIAAALLMSACWRMHKMGVRL